MEADKYEKMAVGLCEDADPSHHNGKPCSLCRHLVVILRECAAQAYEDAARVIKPYGDGVRVKWLLETAASLRSPAEPSKEKP